MKLSSSARRRLARQAGRGDVQRADAALPEPAKSAPPEAPPPRPQPADAVPWAVRVAAAWSWRIVLIGVVVTGLLYLLARFRLVTLPVFVALLLTALMQPAVHGVTRLRVPRVLATAVVFVLGIAAVGGVFYGIVELVLAGLNDLARAVTTGIEQIRRWLVTGPLPTVAPLEDLTNRAQRWIQQNTQRISQGALTTASVLTQLLAGLLLTLVVTFFFLYDGRRIWGWVVRLFPRSVEDRIDGAGRQAWNTLAGYVQGTVVVALFDSVLITAVLFFVGLPVSLMVPLGVLVFFGAFVPLLGALVTGFLAVIATLVTQGLIAALIVLGGVIAVQQIEGNLLQPLVLGRMVQLHPLAVLLTVTAGAIIAGIAGAIVAVPVAAVINTTTAYFFRRPHA